MPLFDYNNDFKKITKKKEHKEESEDEDSESEDEEDQPDLESAAINHNGCVNRIRVSNF